MTRYKLLAVALAIGVPTWVVALYVLMETDSDSGLAVWIVLAPFLALFLGYVGVLVWGWAKIVTAFWRSSSRD